jgi:hypothetical protein
MKPLLLCVAALGVAVSQRSPLDERLSATDHAIFAPAAELANPSDASELGLLSRLARVAQVPFGFEADDVAPRPAGSAPVEQHFITATTLREGLDAFVRLDGRYEWRDIRGVYVVRTARAWTNPSDVLARPVHGVEWHDLSVFTAFDRIAALLYPGSGPLYGALSPRNDRPFAVSVDRGTLLDVLVAAARADGELGWAVRYGRPEDRVKFELTIGHYGAGPTHAWTERPN